MKTMLMSLAAVGFAVVSIGVAQPALADTYTSVTTTTTETPVSGYSYTRRITPIVTHPKATEKSVTVTRSAVVKRSYCSTNKAACVRHTRHVAISSHPRTRVTANSTTTKTITRTIEKPVVIEKVVNKPVYIDRYIDRPVYTDRVVERPVIINRAVVQESPVLIKEKVTHHSDHDTIKIQRYYE